MAKTKPPYPPEFRRQMIELVRVARTPEELSREFEPSAQTIRNWVQQADRDGDVIGVDLISGQEELLQTAVGSVNASSTRCDQREPSGVVACSNPSLRMAHWCTPS